MKLRWKRKGKLLYVTYCETYAIEVELTSDGQHVLHYALYAQDTFINAFETPAAAKQHAEGIAS